ncbi:MAG: hypothetical protein ACETVY_05040 [Candidatus Bathyarchaeia archaeon]
MIFITLVDIKPGLDEEAYATLGELGREDSVTPLLIGRIFEGSDILLLLHSDDLEDLDDYLIRNVRRTAAAEELVVIPIYEFTLLPSFDSVVEIGEEPAEVTTEEAPFEDPAEADELLMFMARVDVAPRMDREVHKAVASLRQGEGVIPLMAGHTFHSKEFDIVLFFLSGDLESAWEFGKRLRSIEGVWDTDFSLIAHFEAMVPLEKFREFVSSRQSGSRE